MEILLAKEEEKGIVMAKDFTNRPYQAIGQRVEEYIKSMNLTQTKAAILFGVSKVHFCRIISGIFEPPASVLQAIASAGGDVAYILTGRRSVGVPAAPVVPCPEVQMEISRTISAFARLQRLCIEKADEDLRRMATYLAQNCHTSAMSLIKSFDRGGDAGAANGLNAGCDLDKEEKE